MVLVAWDEKRDCSVCGKVPVCQQVKAEHQRTVGLLQPLPILESKWENITMDFVTALPRRQKGNNAVLVIVDRLMKSAHFIPFRLGQSTELLAEKYMQKVVRLHVIPRFRNTYLVAYSSFRSYFPIYFPYLTDFSFKYYFLIY